MSLFSESFAQAFTVSTGTFGDTCRINGVVYPCIILSLEMKTAVEVGKPGISQNVGGDVVLSAQTWATVRGKKGMQIAIGDEAFRVINNPNAGYTSDTVLLQLGPVV